MQNSKELGKIILYDKDNIQGIFDIQILTNHIEKYGIDEIIQALSWMTWKVWEIGREKKIYSGVEE